MNDQPITIKERLERIELLLQAIAIGQKKALTMEEACIYTGRTLGSMYNLTSKQQIPHYKPEGKMVYFDREELDQWMLRGRVKTQEEIYREAANYIVNKKNKK